MAINPEKTRDQLKFVVAHFKTYTDKHLSEIAKHNRDADFKMIADAILRMRRAKRSKRNPKSRAQLIRTAKARMKGLGDLNLRGFGAVRETEKSLKAQLKRARTRTVKPKGKLPNPTEYEKARERVIALTKKAEFADQQWQGALDAMGIDRYSPAAKGKPGSLLRGWYDNKLAADERMRKANEALRAVVKKNPVKRFLISAIRKSDGKRVSWDTWEIGEYEAMDQALKNWPKDKYRDHKVYTPTKQFDYPDRKNPKTGSRDAFGVWHAENPSGPYNTVYKQGRNLPPNCAHCGKQFRENNTLVYDPIPGRAYHRNCWIKHLEKQKQNPAEDPDWYDIADEAARLGDQQAKALGHARQSLPKLYKVTWYSPLRKKRTGFIRPIEADSAAEAKRQAKAMVENDPKANNFVAKEVERNPSLKTVNRAAAMRRKGEALIEESFKLRRTDEKKSKALYDKGYALVIKAQRLREKENPNPKEDIFEVSIYWPGDIPRHYHVEGSAGVKAATKTARSVVRQGATEVVIRNLRTGKRVHIEKGGKLSRSQKKRNPSVNAIAEKFQGKADGALETLKAANGCPKNVARAGKLVFLKVNGKTFRLPGAVVCIAPNEKLWIAGTHAPLFETKAKAGQGLDVGEVTHICYETAKSHIGEGKRYEYVHEFGEDGGKRPHLIIDSEGMPILRGGDYKIKAEGIVN